MSVVRRISRHPRGAVLLLGLLLPLLSGQVPDCDCDPAMDPNEGPNSVDANSGAPNDVGPNNAGPNDGDPNQPPQEQRSIALRMDDWVVKSGATFQISVAIESPNFDAGSDTYTVRVTADSADAGGPWEFAYADDAETWSETIDATVAANAAEQIISLSAEILDMNGADLNADGTTNNDYTVAQDSIKIVEDDGVNYDITLEGDAAHYVNWNPYELMVSAQNVPFDAELVQVTIATPTGTSTEAIPHDDIVGGQVLSLELPEGVTTVTAEWQALLLGPVRCGTHTPLEISTEPGGGPFATLTFSPLVPRPAVDLTILIEFAAPCDDDSYYGVAAGGVLKDADGINIPAGETEGSMTLYRTTSGYVRFNVTTNSTCANLTASHDVIFHGAGSLLFDGFAGPVTGSAGAEGTLEVAAEYVTETYELTPYNTAHWNVQYQETSPENFTVALSARAAAYVGGGGGTFSGPGGEYTWALQPYTSIPYDGELVGTFTLTRPDSTVETFSYRLAPK